MSDLSLYKYCLQKIAIFLREGIYKSCHQNPFSFQPSKIVNDLMSTALDLQGTNGLRAEGLQQLLTSGKLQELKISIKDVNIDQLQNIGKVLYFLKLGCQKLEILHLTVIYSLAWERSEVSVARTRSEVFLVRLRSEVSVALENLLTNSPNLKDLHCFFSFDLKGLRKCRELRRLRLHFVPQQHWYEFLAIEIDRFQKHEYLEFFTVCDIDDPERIPHDDVVIILQHCPVLTSLGFMESSEALSRLHRMGFSPSELKLRYCYWREDSNGIQRFKEAVLHCPMIEELDIDVSCLSSITCLKSLRNLVCLNIYSYGNRSGVTFDDELQAFGTQLKHLSLRTDSKMEINLLLQNSYNLESLRIYYNFSDIYKDSFSDFTLPALSLPNLKRLTIDNNYSISLIFSLLSDCNQLTELFLIVPYDLNEQIFINFLRRNSLSNLKVVFLQYWNLTDNGFREFLLKAPQLEIVEIHGSFEPDEHFKRVIRETNSRAQFNKDLMSRSDEFFCKRYNLYDCMTHFL